MSPHRPVPERLAGSAADPDWISLGGASRVLGVSSATVRRWADAGRLTVFTTPGGHRRFSRGALERMLPAERVRRPGLSAAGLTPARLSRAYRRGGAPTVRETAWLAALSPDARQVFAQLGRDLAWQLIAHIDAGDPDSRRHHLAEATALAARYGRHGADLGLAMSDVVEGFLAFRRPFLAEIGAVARRRAFDAEDATRLFADAERALDRLLVATMSGHSLRVGASDRDDLSAPVARLVPPGDSGA